MKNHNDILWLAAVNMTIGMPLTDGDGVDFKDQIVHNYNWLKKQSEGLKATCNFKELS